MYCEPNFTFSLQDKRILTAVEEDVFEIDWPWPEYKASVSSSARWNKEDNVSEDRFGTTENLNCSSHELLEGCKSLDICAKTEKNQQHSGEDTRNRCRTTILSMHIDPHHYEEICVPLRVCSSSLHSSCSGDLDGSSQFVNPDGEQHVKIVHSRRRTRLAAAVLSAGRNVCVPLVPFRPSKHDGPSASASTAFSWSPRVYWEFPTATPSVNPNKIFLPNIEGMNRSNCTKILQGDEKTIHESCNHNRKSEEEDCFLKFPSLNQQQPPPFGEVLVGELSSIRLLMTTLKTSSSEWEELRLALLKESFDAVNGNNIKSMEALKIKREIERSSALCRGNVSICDTCPLSSSLGFVHDLEPVSRVPTRTLKKIFDNMSHLSTKAYPYKWPEVHCEPNDSKAKSAQNGATRSICSLKNSGFSSLPVVYHYFLHTIPYKTLWLRSGFLLLSLSCEERLITLHPCPRTDMEETLNDHVSPTTTGHITDTNSFSTMPSRKRIISGRVELRSCDFLGSFSLPRGVIPLDVVELSHRSAVAVGTMEHGVLLCALDRISGVIQHVDQTFSTCGLGSSIFPITRIVPVLPPFRSSSLSSVLPSEADESGTNGKGCSVHTDWGKVLECNRQSQERGLEASGTVHGGGILLVTSTFETQSFILRLGPTGGGDGVLEECPKELKMVSVETVCGSPQSEVYEGVGALLINFGRGLHELLSVLQDDVNDDGSDDEEKTTEKARKADTLGLTSSCGGFSRGKSQCSVADSRRAWWVPLQKIRVLRSVLRGSNMMLTKLFDGPPIYQQTNESSTYQGRYSKHFILAADACNRIHLLDRRLCRYLLHSPSAITLAEAPHPLSFTSSRFTSIPVKKKGETLEHDEFSSPSSSVPLSRIKRRGKHCDPFKKTAMEAGKSEKGEKMVQHIRENETEGTKSSSALFNALTTQSVVRAENAVAGLVVFEARARGFYVAAAHHQRLISIIHYCASPVHNKRKRDSE